MVGHVGSSAGSYLADPTSPIPFPLCINCCDQHFKELILVLQVLLICGITHISSFINSELFCVMYFFCIVAITLRFTKFSVISSSLTGQPVCFGAFNFFFPRTEGVYLSSELYLHCGCPKSVLVSLSLY